MKILLWLISIILMALYSFSLDSKGIQTLYYYELIIDFGGDDVYIHEVLKNRTLCERKAKSITQVEKVKAYCVERKF